MVGEGGRGLGKVLPSPFRGEKDPSGTSAMSRCRIVVDGSSLTPILEVPKSSHTDMLRIAVVWSFAEIFNSHRMGANSTGKGGEWLADYKTIFLRNFVCASSASACAESKNARALVPLGDMVLHQFAIRDANDEFNRDVGKVYRY